MGPNRVMPLLLAAFCAYGCRSVTTSYRYPDDLTHPDYVKRSKAVREFAQRRDPAQLPAAFDLLLDEEGHIRLLAYVTIRALSPGGEDFGYRPELPANTRRAIVKRWRAWWIRSPEGGTGRE